MKCAKCGREIREDEVPLIEIDLDTGETRIICTDCAIPHICEDAEDVEPEDEVSEPVEEE